MTTKNLLPATIEAVAESDNEIGGMLVTRLRKATNYGGDDAELSAITPGHLQSRTINAFAASDVGRLLDILTLPNRGTFRVATFNDPGSVEVVDVAGTAPVWIGSTDVRWRWSSIQVESALDFATRDRNLRLWIDNESLSTPYCGTVVLPGAQEFIGLGPDVSGVDGEIDPASPQRLVVKAAGTFASGDTGKSLWILPMANGAVDNAGWRVIATVVDDKTVDLAGPAFVTSESGVWWRMKTYDEDGYLARLHPEDAEVYDGGEGYSGLDRLRRALQVDYAEGEELDRIARRHGLSRPRGCPDETWRRLLMVLPYLAKTPVYALELAMAALFPEGGWSVYEDLVGHPCEVFIDTPVMEVSEVYEGKAFLEEVLWPTSSDANTIPVTSDPTTICSIRVGDVLQELAMTVLPSAADPAWAYQNEGAAEGSVFSVSGGLLVQAQAGGTANGGRYEREIAWIGPGQWKLGVWWRIDSHTASAGAPWKLIVCDGEREVCLFWDFENEVSLGSVAEVALDTVDWTWGDATDWHRIEIECAKGVVRANIDGRTALSVPWDDFGASSDTLFSFGYVNNGDNQTWTCQWDGLRIWSANDREWTNVRRADGVIGMPGSSLSSASSPFTADDDGRRVAVYSQDWNQNDGVWLASYVGAGQLDLVGEVRADEAKVETGDDTISRIILRHPRLTDRDANKYIKIAGSSATPSNNGSYWVVAIQDEYTAVVFKAGGFVTETGLDWSFDESQMVAESGLMFEVVGTASYATSNITVRDALPAAATPVRVAYTTIPSAQVLLDEFVHNDGAGGTVGEIYYPMYLADVDRLTREIIDAIVAAGVIPRYGITQRGDEG
ncbi:MAG: hypothetical protein MUC88_00475 [Planctomycetes bacterium]|jgi:hypothetical protein|nr:hypothetical protein [Planctomycetota bacterium]